MTRIIKDFEELKALHESWNTLYERDSLATPFQTFEYCIACVETGLNGGGKIHVISVSQNEQQPSAIFPCFLDERQILRFINDLNTDFCDAIISDDKRRDYTIYEEVVQYIISNTEIQGVCFINLRATSCTGSFLSTLLYPSQNYVNNAYSIFVIAERAEKEHYVDTLHHLNAKERHRVKKVCNKMDAASFELYQAKDEYPNDLMSELMQQMISDGIRTTSYIGQIKSLVQRLFESGLLIIGVTIVDNQPLAANIFLRGRINDEYINWLVFYKDKQYNLWNILQCIEFISNTGGGRINFARGTYEYKMRNFRPAVHCLYRFEYSKTIGGHAGILKKQLIYHIRKIGKSIVVNSPDSIISKLILRK